MNSPDPDRPENLIQVASEVEAAAIVTALQAHGIEALASGGFTSGFRAEAPGRVNVVVRHQDLEEARLILAEIQGEPSDGSDPSDPAAQE